MFVGLQKLIRLASFVLTCFGAAVGQNYTITDLGALKGANESNGFWINSAGQVVGCSDVQSTEGYPCTGTTAGQRAFLWTPGVGMQSLGTLWGGNISAALGINDSGEVVGYSNTKNLPANDFIAVLWTPGGNKVGLGTLRGGSSSCAFSINTTGEVTGDSFNSLGIVDATSWTNNQIRNLKSLPTAIFTAGLPGKGGKR
jgi:probable HAF family extracellular repeat protein